MGHNSFFINAVLFFLGWLPWLTLIGIILWVRASVRNNPKSK